MALQMPQLVRVADDPHGPDAALDDVDREHVPDAAGVAQHPSRLAVDDDQLEREVPERAAGAGDLGDEARRPRPRRPRARSRPWPCRRRRRRARRPASAAPPARPGRRPRPRPGSAPAARGPARDRGRSASARPRRAAGAHDELTHARLVALEHLRDPRVVVVEDLAQHEGRALQRREALQRDQQRLRDRVRELGPLVRPQLRVDDQRLGQPRADVGLAPHAGQAQVVDRQPRGDGRDPGRGLVRRRVERAHAQQRLLRDVLGLGDAARASGSRPRTPAAAAPRRSGGAIEPFQQGEDRAVERDLEAVALGGAHDRARQALVLERAAREPVEEHRGAGLGRQRVVEGERARHVLVRQRRALRAADRDALEQQPARELAQAAAAQRPGAARASAS